MKRRTFLLTSACSLSAARRSAAQPGTRPPAPFGPTPSPRQLRWHEIRKPKQREPVRAEDYELLHAEYPRYTYATLWAVVHEFDKE